MAAMQAQAAARQAAHDAERVAASQRKQQQNAYNLTTKAVAASHKGDWSSALTLLRQSYALNPTAETLSNIRTATLHVIQMQGSTALAAEDAGIGREKASDRVPLISANSAIATQLQQLDEAMRKVATIPATGGSDLFLTKSRFGATLPALVTTPLPATGVNSVLQQLSSISASSVAAATATSASAASLSDASIEIAKAVSGCGFDGAPCATPQALTYPHPVQTPAATALEAQIPAARRNDPLIQEHLREYDHFQSHLAEKQQQIAEVNRSIAAGGVDTAVLKAYKADLQHQAAQDQQSSAQTIDFLHMHIPTIAAPAALTGSTARTGSATPAAHP